MQDNNVYDTVAPLLIERGLRPVPIGPGTKRPQVWRKSTGAFEDWKGWPSQPVIKVPQPGAGIGVCLMNDLVAVDLDDEDIAIALLDVLPDTPVRKIGKRGETLFYRGPGIRSRKYRIDGKSVCEILAVGTQTVIPPTIHPDTQCAYRWSGTRTLLNTPVKDLPLLTDGALEKVADTLAHYGYEEESEHCNGEEASPFRALNEAALDDLAAWVPALGLYKCRRRAGRRANYEAVATWRPSSTGRPDEQRKLNLGIAKSGIKDFGTGKTYTPIDLVMAALACPFNEAAAFLDEKLGWSTGGPEIKPEEEPREEAQDAGPEEPAGAQKEEPAAGAGAGGGRGNTRPARVILKPWTFVDPQTFPPRRYLYGKHYQRGVVTATVAPGGSGKTSLDLVDAVTLATGRDLLGEPPQERCRVWLHNGEDSREELERRVLAICQHYAIPQEELFDWLFLTSGNEMPLKVANGYADLKLDTPLIKEIGERIGDQRVDVAMFDPLVTLHSVPENDNTKMDAVIRIFARLADVHECGLDLSHHMRKGPSGFVGDHVIEDMRGAVAVRDACRSIRLLNGMSAEEGENIGLLEFEHLLHFRVDRGKANTLKPGEKAIWRRFENVILPNDDNVGVVTAWEHPGRNMSDEAMRRAEAVFLAILDRLTSSNRAVSDRTGRRYAPNVFAEEHEAVLSRIGKAQLKGAMESLLRKEVIRVEESGPPSKPDYRLVRA